MENLNVLFPDLTEEQQGKGARADQSFGSVTLHNSVCQSGHESTELVSSETCSIHLLACNRETYRQFPALPRASYQALGMSLHEVRCTKETLLCIKCLVSDLSPLVSSPLCLCACLKWHGRNQHPLNRRECFPGFFPEPVTLRRHQECVWTTDIFLLTSGRRSCCVQYRSTFFPLC